MMQKIPQLTFQFNRLGLKCASTKVAATTNKTKPTRLPRLPAGFNSPTAYTIFLKENYKTGTISNEAGRIAGLWKQLPIKEKQVFQDKAKEVATERREAFAKLSSEEQAALQQKRIQKTAKRRQRRHNSYLRQYKTDTARPKAPTNGYIRFSKEQLNSKVFTNREDAMKAVKDISEQWKKLTDAEKKPYIDQYLADKAKFQKDLETWEKKYGKDYKIYRKKNPSKSASGAQRSSGLLSRIKKRRAASAKK